MLAEQVLRIGPLNLPYWILAVAAALLVVAVLDRTVFRADHDTWSATADALLSGLLAGFVVWKLMPLVTRFSQIRELPSRLLYYPGGIPGVVAGLVVGLAITAYSLVRRDVPRDRRTLLHLAMPVSAAGLGVLALALVPVEHEPFTDLEALEYLPGYEISPDESRATVVTVWATWCGPCTAQMPEVERFYRQHGSNVNLIALNLTGTEQSTEVVDSYLEASGLTFPVALERTGTTAASLGIESTPTTIVFDAQGRERARRTGAVNADWLARRVLPFGR
ncbi:MAG: TlpA family protein disulfide reductase [Spirochaetota bacterium]